jgi:HlyD family secretion protein
MQRLSGPVALLVGLAAATLALLWLRREPEPTPPPTGGPPRTLPVLLGTVERGTLRPVVELVGTVRAARRAAPGFEIGGSLRSVPLLDGEAVEAGAELARLDDALQRTAVLEAESALALAQRELQRLEAGERAEVVARLRAEVTTAKADLELAELELARSDRLLSEQVVSQATLDRNRALRDAAAGQLAAAEQSLAEAEAGSRAEDLAVAAAQVAVAEAQLATARRELERTVLFAPFAGTVVARLAQEGDAVGAGDALYDLVDLSALEIDLRVPARYAVGLSGGAPVRLRLDERPEVEIEAALAVLVPVADEESRNFRALVRIARGEPGFEWLAPGQFVRARVDLAPLEDVAIVDQDAVRLVDGGQVLVVAQPAAESAESADARRGPAAAYDAQWLPVRILAAAGEQVAVEPLDGELAAGTRVVLTGIEFAFPGTRLMASGQDPATEQPAAESGAEGESSR